MNKLQPNVCPKVNTTSTLAFKEVGRQVNDNNPA
jgi:hypothetical protein